MATLGPDAPSQGPCIEKVTASPDAKKSEIVVSSHPVREEDDNRDCGPIVRDSPTAEKLKTLVTSSTTATYTQVIQPLTEPHTDGDGQQWSVHWYLPSAMVFKFFMGLGFALGHHLYYRSLHLSLVGSPWPVQVGTTLAFITQRCFVGAVLTAYSQWAWVGTYLSLRRRLFGETFGNNLSLSLSQRTLNRKPLQLSTIDGVFAVSAFVFSTQSTADMSFPSY